MKPSDLIIVEATDSDLITYVRKNSGNFYVSGNTYLFVWTNLELKKLIKSGAIAGEHLRNVLTPSKNSVGLGILNIVTRRICVGAISHEYEGLWASSDDTVAKFFHAVKNRNIRDLPSRLQELADILSVASDREDSEDSESEYEPKGQGVEKIVDLIANSDDYFGIDKDFLKELENASGVEEVRTKIEKRINDLKHEMRLAQPRREKITSLLKAPGLSDKEKRTLAKHIGKQLAELPLHTMEIDHLEKFLDKEGHLFNDDTEVDDTDTDKNDDDSTDTDTSKEDLKAWVSEFNRDFPGLDLGNVYDFDPNVAG